MGTQLSPALFSLKPLNTFSIAPPLLISDIAAVIQTGFVPIFADIDPHHLGMDTKNIISAVMVAEEFL